MSAPQLAPGFAALCAVSEGLGSLEDALDGFAAIGLVADTFGGRQETIEIERRSLLSLLSVFERRFRADLNSARHALKELHGARQSSSGGEA